MAQWAKVTGWACWRWVYPGMMVSRWAFAFAMKAFWSFWAFSMTNSSFTRVSIRVAVAPRSFRLRPVCIAPATSPIIPMRWRSVLV
jgi:hypothetical protein